MSSSQNSHFRVEDTEPQYDWETCRAMLLQTLNNTGLRFVIVLSSIMTTTWPHSSVWGSQALCLYSPICSGCSGDHTKSLGLWESAHSYMAHGKSLHILVILARSHYKRGMVIPRFKCWFGHLVSLCVKCGKIILAWWNGQRYMKMSCSNPDTWLTLNVHFSLVLGNGPFREFTRTFRNYLD